MAAQVRGVTAGVRRGFMALMVLAGWCAPVHAAWETRVTDGVMGTRITVEVWAEDAAQADQANAAVLAAMRRIDDDHEHL